MTPAWLNPNAVAMFRREAGLTRTITATLMGDPMPGRSALDARGRDEPSPLALDRPLSIEEVQDRRKAMLVARQRVRERLRLKGLVRTGGGVRHG